MENNKEALPQDVQNEILLRMPVKSLGKCICVSNNWAALIREKTFRDQYLLQSKTRPRLLFVFSKEEDPNVLFHSVYQEKEPLLSSGLQQTHTTLEPRSYVCAVIGGLVCIKSTTKVVLCNPGTKKFLILPELNRDHSEFFGRTYLGYDEATDVFKVLSLTEKRLDDHTLECKDYRVLTLGSGEECWRTIVYEPLHLPITEGLCKDGVLYYVAISKGNFVLMSFNLRSEELNVIELPHWKQDLIGISLVNYNGEIALVDWLVEENGEFTIWVRNEVAGDWRKEHIVIPSWTETVGDMCEAFCFKGTIGTGELVFAQGDYNIEGSVFVLYYDRITQHLRKFEIEGVASDKFHYVETYLDHVDSLSLM